jgi:glutamate carboxypeptidase
MSGPSGKSKGLLDWARARAPEMVVLLRALVEIESPSDDPAGVAALAERLRREFLSLSFQTECLPVEGAGPILRARSGRGEEKPILILGHLDTVWPLGTLGRRGVHLTNGRLFGPGSYDMKGGLVVALFALRALKEHELLPPVTVFFTPLEEVGSDIYQSLMVAEMRSSAAVLDFEPAWPGGALKTERKGSASFTLKLRGRAAHAGADFEKGASAIRELAQKVLEVSAFTDLARGTTVNVGLVRGGIRPNVVPDFAEAQVDVRYQTKAEGERLERAFRSLKAAIPGVSLEVEGGGHYPPLERGPHVRAVYAHAERVGREMGLPVSEVSTGGASEASFAAALGIPTLDGLGPDGDGAHAETEHVLISSLPERAALAAGIIARLSSEATKQSA